MQAQALDLLLCGACHGHRFYMILLMSSAVPPSHRRVVVSHRVRIRLTTILHTYCTAVQLQPRQFRAVPPPALEGASFLLLLFFLPALPRSHCSLRPGPNRPLVSCLVAQQVSSLQVRSTKETIVLVQPHGQNKQSLGHSKYC